MVYCRRKRLAEADHRHMPVRRGEEKRMEKDRMTALLRREGRPGLWETFGAVMLLAWPAILEQIMITAVQYVDTAMVGRLGASATAAVGLMSSSIWLFNGLFGAAAVGFSVQVAQYLGAGRAESAREVTAQSLRFILLFGVLVGAVALGLSFPLPHWLGAAPDVAPEAGWYFRIIAVGMPFTLGVNMVSAILRCAGDTRSPMILNTLINVINMVLNFFLIYPSRSIPLFGREVFVPGAGLGVKGAALASIIATGIVFGIFLLLLFRRPSPVRLSHADSRSLRPDCLRTVVRLGVPVALERVTMCMAQILITGLISGIGTVAMAANHLAVTAESLSYSPAYGVAVAATTLVGQAIGAGRKDLAMRFAKMTTYIGIGIMTLGGILLYVLATPLITLFTPDQAVIALGTRVLRIVAFAEPLFGAAIVSSGALRGAGDSRGPFLICLGTMWGVRLTLNLLLVKPLGLIGVWLAMAAELIARGVIFLTRLFSGRWMHMELFSRSGQAPPKDSADAGGEQEG